MTKIDDPICLRKFATPKQAYELQRKVWLALYAIMQLCDYAIMHPMILIHD